MRERGKEGGDYAGELSSGEGKFTADGEFPKQMGNLRGTWADTFSLDLWMSSLYTFLATVNY